jgi:HK97 family phage portal protein
LPPSPAEHPGDPEGVTWEGDDTLVEDRGLPAIFPSPWNGWPQDWATPDWTDQSPDPKLDVVWSAIDTTANILATMPVYRLRAGKIIEPTTWMTNPDPGIYSSWAEFAKQLFWDFQLAGEAFVMPFSRGADGYPAQFRVIPPWLVTVEMVNGVRRYKLGAADVSADICHVRYQSRTDDPRGHSPLEVAGLRMTVVTCLQRYAEQLSETGGTPDYWLGVDRRLNKTEADELLEQWVTSRIRNAGYPAILSGKVTLNQTTAMNARDMALLELSQFNESRLAVLLGVPPFLVGLPSGGDSMTYSNVSSLFDFHDRSSLRPKAAMVMSALSGWALPRGQTVEVNRDEYTRPGLLERANAYKILVEIGGLTSEEIRAMERFQGTPAPAALTGLDTTTTAGPTAPAGSMEGLSYG